MMHSQKSNVVIAEGLAEHYRSGGFSVQLSLPMPKNKGSGLGIDQDREPFITIDDLVQKSQELFCGLQKLSEIKNPLEIRRGVGKGVKKSMTEESQSIQIKGAGRTYFLDVEKTKDGKAYLRITESRKAEGDNWERNKINVFPEDADEFAKAVSKIVAKLG